MNGISESQRSEINHALAGEQQLRRDQQLLHEQSSQQNRDLRDSHMKSLNEMEELKRFQGSTFDEFSRRRLIENQDTILELTARIQEQQNEGNCLNDSRDLKNAESVRSGQSHVASLVYRETFLQIQRRLLQHLVRKSSILGFLMRQNIHHRM